MVWTSNIGKSWLKQKAFSKQAQAFGWGGAQKKNNVKAVPDEIAINKEQRYQGVVESYQKWKGYGWIKMSQSGVLPGDKVFLYWKSIKSDDRCPSCQKDSVVEFGLHPYRNKEGKKYVRAKNVTLPGGLNINLQDEIDAVKKTFVGDQYLRYTGKLLFFHKKKGFGYIKMDEGYALTEPVPSELRVEEAEFNAGKKEPLGITKELDVEFGIWKTSKGQYKAYNMTFPGMVPITQELLEGRQTSGQRMYSGTITQNMWKQGYGFIEIDSGINLPPQISQKMMEMKAKSKNPEKVPDRAIYFRASDVKEGAWLKKGQKVQFHVYTDEKGCGAMDIQ